MAWRRSGRNQGGRGKSQRNLDLIPASREILAEIQPVSVHAVCYWLFLRGLIEFVAQTCRSEAPVAHKHMAESL